MARRRLRSARHGELFRTIEKESGPGGPQWMSDHPNPGQSLRVHQQGGPSAARAGQPAAGDRGVPERPGAPPLALAGAFGRRSSAQPERGPHDRRRRDDPAHGRGTGNIPRPDSRTTTYTEGNLFRVSVPANWRELASNNTVTFAPDGAYGSLNGNSVFTHGAEIGCVAQRKPRSADRDQRAAPGAAPEQSAAERPRQLRARLDRRAPGAARRPVRTSPTRPAARKSSTSTRRCLSDGSLFYVLGVAPREEYSTLRERIPQRGPVDPAGEVDARGARRGPGFSPSRLALALD